MSDHSTPRTDAQISWKGNTTTFVCIGFARDLECEIYETQEELAAALAELANVKDDFDAAIEQRDKEIQKRKEICKAAVKLLKYLRPHLTHESQKLVDEADAAMKEWGE